MKSFLSSISAVFAALLSCVCCVGPFLSLAGLLGVSTSNLVWLASIKNYLIFFSLLAISYNLYRAYFPRKTEECCDLNQQELVQKLDKRESKVLSFLQSKTFLWTIAILTLIILILPYLNL
ncbi:hypothetical protein [Aureivirga sp. CE67]|uniref:hypothetical protein n=1 Tax=Aureivirga sp. CE67 TaxID=1788983 RepID=UPI0018CB4727|nr:hypothetical protein [Aureivirga sp. CE67]